LQLKVYEEIDHISDKLKKIDGIAAVVLFGSYSRGDFEEGSDIDLLVIFKDKGKMADHLRDVYKITSQGGLFIQAVCLTLEELMGSPLLQPVLREGKKYYADKDAKAALTPLYTPYALITYSTVNLDPKKRVVVAQKLEGRGKGKYRYDGLIQKLNGFKVGRGVLMVPLDNVGALTRYLEEERIDYVTRHVWA